MIAIIGHKVHARTVCLVAGIYVFLLSLTVLLTSFANASHITGYLAQADAAFPYVQRGLFTAALAVSLCCFGKGAPRILAVLLSSLLLLYWLFLGATLY